MFVAQKQESGRILTKKIYLARHWRIARVRRAFLCGQDPLTGQKYNHRKDWIQDGMEDLAGIFAVDVLGFTVTSNQVHVVPRSRPDLAAEWSDEEVLRRWCRWFHRTVGRASSMAAPASRSGKQWFHGTVFSRLAFD